MWQNTNRTRAENQYRKRKKKKSLQKTESRMKNWTEDGKEKTDKRRKYTERDTCNSRRKEKGEQTIEILKLQKNSKRKTEIRKQERENGNSKAKKKKLGQYPAFWPNKLDDQSRLSGEIAYPLVKQDKVRSVKLSGITWKASHLAPPQPNTLPLVRS